MINVANINRLDLNLLLVFHCLMMERSVTRAASNLNVTQGAISSALKRLRLQYEDPLFVRTGTGMVPTRRALEIAPKVVEALTAVTAACASTNRTRQDTPQRVFNIAMSDDIESYLSPDFVEASREQGISFAFHQTNSTLWKQTLSDPDIDLVLCAEPKELTSQFSAQVLFSSSYSCLYDGPRLNLKSPLSREDYLSHEHVRISFDGRRGFVDDLLESEGIRRHVCASFTHFGGILPILAFGRAIATLPTFAAYSYARIARLTVSPVPIYVPSFRIFMVWNMKRNGDPHNQWLRNLVVDRTRRLQHVSSP